MENRDIRFCQKLRHIQGLKIKCTPKIGTQILRNQLLFQILLTFDYLNFIFWLPKLFTFHLIFYLPEVINLARNACKWCGGIFNVNVKNAKLSNAYKVTRINCCSISPEEEMSNKSHFQTNNLNQQFRNIERYQTLIFSSSSSTLAQISLNQDQLWSIMRRT